MKTKTDPRILFYATAVMGGLFFAGFAIIKGVIT